MSHRIALREALELGGKFKIVASNSCSILFLIIRSRKEMRLSTASIPKPVTVFI